MPPQISPTGIVVALVAAGFLLGALFGALVAVLLQGRRRALAIAEEQACLQAALDPVRKEFADFERILGETRAADAAESAALRQRLSDDLRRVGDLVLRVGADAKGLQSALQGNVNLRGQWGETVLEQILRNSGLLPGIHYNRQVTLQGGAKDDTKRPDTVAWLPDGTAVVIDSKTLFPDYARAIDAQTPEERSAALKAHVQAFRNTVRSLAARHYEQRVEHSLDFVLMFLPVEGAYQAAVSEDPSVLTEAMAKNVLPVGPSALILMLTLIRRIWKRDEEQRNTERILEAARILAERTLSFNNDLDAMGAALAKAQAVYENALRRIRSTEPRAASVANSLRTLQRLQGENPVAKDDGRLL